jgi:hypothetical protein
MDLLQALDTLQQARGKLGEKASLHRYGSLANPTYLDKLVAVC